MVAADAFDHFAHKVFVITGLDAFLRRSAFVHQQVQQPIDFGVGESQLAFIRLAGPQVGSRRLDPHRLGHGHSGCQLAHLGLVQVAQRVEPAGRIAVECGVAQQNLGLVARTDHQPAKRRRLVVQHDHAHARHDIAAPQAGHLGETLQQRLGHGGDLDGRRLNPGRVDHALRIIQRVLR